MYRVAIDTKTGKIIEMQSGGRPGGDDQASRDYADACLATLRQNAVNAGYKPEDIDVKWISAEEYAAALAGSYTVDEVRGIRNAAIDAIRDDKIKNGVTFTFPGDVAGSIQTRSDADFRNITGFSAAGLALTGQPAVLQFRDQEDRVHELTPQQAVELGLAVTQAVSAIYQVAWAHKDALAALQSRQEIESYDITVGWPS